MTDIPRVVLKKTVLGQQLWWDGNEWHPDRTRAIEYPEIGGYGRMMLADIILKQEYGIEPA